MIQRKIFAANWKLHKTPAETRKFLLEFKTKLDALQLPYEKEVVFFPSAISLEAASEVLKESRVKCGVQNVCSQGSGAFTGENSALVAKELGATYILIGHSERRHLFHETDDLIAEKVNYVQSLGLTPILCIGETLSERESQKTKEVCARQLKVGLSRAHATKPLVIAYEPVWAIGTGKVATSEQVEETHTDVYNILKEIGFPDGAILYGGSVKADNAKGLVNRSHVSGFLVGGASLEVDNFLQICISG